MTIVLPGLLRRKLFLLQTDGAPEIYIIDAAAKILRINSTPGDDSHPNSHPMVCELFFILPGQRQTKIDWGKHISRSSHEIDGSD